MEKFDVFFEELRLLEEMLRTLRPDQTVRAEILEALGTPRRQMLDKEEWGEGVLPPHLRARLKEWGEAV